MDGAQVLNLITLAKSSPAGAAVPGTGLEVAVITEPSKAELERDLWLLVLTGELIIDLPHGDFRILKKGDAVQLDAGLKLSYQPVEDAVVLRRG